jgi:hypothetical protein
MSDIAYIFFNVDGPPLLFLRNLLDVKNWRIPYISGNVKKKFTFWENSIPSRSWTNFFRQSMLFFVSRKPNQADFL